MQKLQKYQPKITVFNGKGIYEVFNACFGKRTYSILATKPRANNVSLKTKEFIGTEWNLVKSI